MQMAESRRGYALVQLSMRSSNPLACTLLFSAVVAELLISRHVPCNKFLFLVQNFHFRLIPKDYREYHRVSCKKAWIPRTSFSTREGWADQILLRSVLELLRNQCSPVTIRLVH